MLALEVHPNLMGLTPFGQEEVPSDEDETRERLMQMKRRLYLVGIPATVGSAALTTILFAGAFRAAQTSRIWAPAFVLGGAAFLGGLGRLVASAVDLYRLEQELEQEEETVPLQVEPLETTAPPTTTSSTTPITTT